LGTGKEKGNEKKTGQLRQNKNGKAIHQACLSVKKKNGFRLVRHMGPGPGRKGTLGETIVRGPIQKNKGRQRQRKKTENN